MISLLFNHALLEGAAHRPLDAAQGASAMLRAVEHARRLWPETVFYVHERLWEVEAAPGQPFQPWAAGQANRPELRDPLRQLLNLCTWGPFLRDLPCDDLGEPEDLVPLPEEAGDDLLDVLQRGLHHRLAFPAERAWLLSFGRGAEVLSAPAYAGRRGTASETLPNARDEEAAQGLFDAAAMGALGTRQAVLDLVTQTAPRVRFLDRVPKGIQRAHIDVPLPKLYAALAGLGTFAAALERGEPASEAYKEATGVDVSDESTSFHQQPNRRRQVEFTIPGETARTVFGWHAKVGESTRIHFVWRQGTWQGPGGPEHGLIIWVGRIDKHPR